MGWGTKLVLGGFAVGATVMVCLIGLSFLVPRVVDRAVEAYTDARPALPALPEVSKEEAEAVHTRVDAYDKALDAHEAREPLVLTERDVNSLLADSMKGDDGAAVGVQLLPGQVRAQVSLRLTQTLPLGPWSRNLTGRYLNGVATFDAGVRDGALELRLAEFEMKGRRLPEYVLDVLRGEMERSGVLEDEGVRKFLDKVSSVQFDSGQITIAPPVRP
jgi:hypothetical protein